MNLGVVRLRESVERSAGRERPDDIRLMSAVIDVLEALVDAPVATRGELAAVEDAMRCPRVAVSSCAGIVLAELATRHAAAQEAFRALLASPRAAERFQAISYVSDRMPRALVEELLGQGLRDRSGQVRERAAELSARFGIASRPDAEPGAAPDSAI
jgi:hypothetical protein